VSFVDTHAHLADRAFEPDRTDVLKQAQDAGVATLIEIAESPDTWDAALALAEGHPNIFVSVGIHPHHAHLAGPDVWDAIEKQFRERLTHPKVVAVGEFGLDYYRMQNTKEQQHFILHKQLELAREFQKPIVIHCREDKTITPEFQCHHDLQNVLSTYYPAQPLTLKVDAPVGVIHCFTGTWADAQFYMEHGFVLGIDGPVTYPGAKTLHDNVRRIPAERIVLETDSPYLPPQAHRGQRNEPRHIPTIAAAIATLRNTTPERIAQITTETAHALFRLKSLA